MRSRLDPACAEARESASDAPLDLERIALHRRRCDGCRAHAEREAEVRRSLDLITRRGLDDLSRERIRARLTHDFDRLASENARGRSRTKGWIVVAIAASILLLWLMPRPELEPPPRLDALTPFLVAGTTEARLGATEAIEASSGMIVRAVLRGKGDVTLLGPGRASMESADRLVLERGLLLVHVNGPFEVRAGEQTVRVTGTRFAVDRRDLSSTRVVVAEGSVEIAGTVRVSGGESWPREATVGELSAPQLEPPTDPSGVVVIGGTPAGAIAMLDGIVLGPTPLIARLSRGPHRVEVHAESFVPFEQTIDVLENGVIDVSFALRLPPVAPPLAPRIRPLKARDERVDERIEIAETAESLYQRAEAALAAGNDMEARARLEDLLSRYESDPLAESALYELARIAYEDGSFEEAHSRSVRLIERRPDPALAESGQRILCQIDLEMQRYDAANTCWRSFRRRFPSSVHDAEAMTSLIAVAHVFHDCARVRELAEEFRSKHADHALMNEVEARLSRCSD